MSIFNLVCLPVDTLSSLVVLNQKKLKFLNKIYIMSRRGPKYGNGSGWVKEPFNEPIKIVKSIDLFQGKRKRAVKLPLKYFEEMSIKGIDKINLPNHDHLKALPSSSTFMQKRSS